MLRMHADRLVGGIDRLSEGRSIQIVLKCPLFILALVPCIDAVVICLGLCTSVLKPIACSNFEAIGVSSITSAAGSLGASCVKD